MKVTTWSRGLHGRARLWLAAFIAKGISQPDTGKVPAGLPSNMHVDQRF
jgi:hypothetical protein